MEQGAYNRPVIFDAIPPLCAKTNALINDVFGSPEAVISKFVLNIYQGKLKVRSTLCC